VALPQLPGDLVEIDSQDLIALVELLPLPLEQPDPLLQILCSLLAVDQVGHLSGLLLQVMHPDNLSLQFLLECDRLLHQPLAELGGIRLFEGDLPTAQGQRVVLGQRVLVPALVQFQVVGQTLVLGH
jgi:hypothetical protein